MDSGYLLKGEQPRDPVSLPIWIFFLFAPSFIFHFWLLLKFWGQRLLGYGWGRTAVWVKMCKLAKATPAVDK